MVRCMLRRISEVLRLPVLLRSLSNRARVTSPALVGRSGCVAPGFISSPAEVGIRIVSTNKDSRSNVIWRQGFLITTAS